MINFRALYEAEMVSQEDLALFEIVDDVEAAWEFMWSARLTAHTPPAHQGEAPWRHPKGEALIDGRS